MANSEVTIDTSAKKRFESTNKQKVVGQSFYEEIFEKDGYLEELSANKRQAVEFKKACRIIEGVCGNLNKLANQL